MTPRVSPVPLGARIVTTIHEGGVTRIQYVLNGKPGQVTLKP